MELLSGIVFSYFFASAYGLRVGYQFFHEHDPLRAAIGGCSTAFIAAMLAWVFFLWPIVRRLGNGLFSIVGQAQLTARRKIRQPAPIPAKDLEAAIRRGYLFAYYGLVDRDYHYQKEGRYQPYRFRNSYTVQRNTATVTKREQDAIIIFETLAGEGRLTGKSADRLRFALAWGDGRGEIGHGAYKVPGGVWSQNGIKGFRDVVAAEAAETNISTDAAISILYTMLQNAESDDPPSHGAVRLLKRERATESATAGSAQWS